MIYIISGIAKSGKTYIAKELTKRYHIPYFSTDYIMMMLAKGNENLKIDVDACDHTVSQKLEPYIYALISTMVHNKIDYVVEGVHFNPDFGAKLIEEFKGKVKIIYLGY
ncbi:MAG: adenylate kinase, partial [Bacilli bacterium]|nr:adenylate kinase [Bacilli bacterium]